MRVYLLAFLVLVIANIYVYRAVYAAPALEVQVFTVGKGNAALVRTPTHKTLLIDAGSDASILRALGAVLPMWQRRIDAVVLTSSDSRSIGGLPEVTHRYHTPTPVRYGGDTPYGTPLVFDTDTHVTVAAPHALTISYGTSAITISSSTPAGIYRFSGTD